MGSRARLPAALLAPALVLLALLLGACPRGAGPAQPPPHAAASSSTAPLEVPLAEVTLQFVLEKAWDGKLEDCQRYAQVAMTINADDLETMELYLRCANARGLLWAAEQWVKSAYTVRMASPVARYAAGMTALLRGEPLNARKVLERLGAEAPVAWYQAAIAAQIDDDAVAAEELIGLYVKAVPNDPAGRALQAEIVCSIDLVRCEQAMQTLRSSDDDDTAIARRLGAAIGTPAAISRDTLTALAKQAGGFGAPAFDDVLSVMAATREGGDPAMFVRSPRSGRPEPGPGADLARDARPMSRLPFITRVLQSVARGDVAAIASSYGDMLALFPTDLATYHVAKRAEKSTQLARKQLGASAQVIWRVVAASELARSDEQCELVAGFPWTDRGPAATTVRARCEISSDGARGRKIADDRLHSPPFGAIDVQTAIDGEANQKDHVALEALARRIAKIAPTSLLVADALWAAAEASGKKGNALFNEALVQSSFDPSYARRLLRRYVEAKDVDRAKLTIAQALTEAPLDAYLCGVEGEILLEQGHAADALAWLTKSCQSARARRETETLSDTTVTIYDAVAKAKDKPAKDAALKCVKGE